MMNKNDKVDEKVDLTSAQIDETVSEDSGMLKGLEHLKITKPIRERREGKDYMIHDLLGDTTIERI